MSTESIREKTINEFAFAASPSPELLRRLMYHAVTGNEFIITPFRLPEGAPNSPRAQAARERKEQDRQAWMQAVMASQERIERFRTELKEFENKRLELLVRTKEELRVAKEKLQRHHDAAPEIEFPDGTRRKVFRDHDSVRDESGTPVDPAIIRAEAVSNNPEHWQENVSFRDGVGRLEARRDKFQKIGEAMEDAGRRADNGEMSDREMDRFKSDLDRVLADEEQAMNEDRARGPAAKERTFRTTLAPTPEFMAAAAAMNDDADETAENDVRPQGPTVSAPAPR